MTPMDYRQPREGGNPEQRGAGLLARRERLKPPMTADHAKTNRQGILKHN
jgi:hypothetical protein